MARSATTATAVANIASVQTDAPLVTAVPGFKIRVVAAVVVTGGSTTNVTFTTKGAGAGVPVTALLALAVRAAFVLPVNEHGWFETKAGEGLSVTTGGTTDTGFNVSYALIPAY